MTSQPFEITRSDGKSNAEVILDLVKDAEPGHVFQFVEMAEALSANTEKEYGVEDVRRIVAAMYSRLLREQQRALHSIRGVGYRLAPGEFPYLSRPQAENAAC